MRKTVLLAGGVAVAAASLVALAWTANASDSGDGGMIKQPTDVVHQSVQQVDTGTHEPQPWNAGRCCVRSRGPGNKRQQLLDAYQFGWAIRFRSSRRGSHSDKHPVLSLIVRAGGAKR